MVLVVDQDFLVQLEEQEIRHQPLHHKVIMVHQHQEELEAVEEEVLAPQVKHYLQHQQL